MDSVMAVFGRRVRALRKAKGLTQEDLGKSVDLDYKHIGRLERGEFGASFEAVQRIATVLQVDYFELFLPDDFTPRNLEQTLTKMVGDTEGIDPAAMVEFLRDLLRAVSKLRETKSE